MAVDLFDVYEVEIRPPNNCRLMQAGLPKEDAEAFVKMAVMRRGVENHFYTTRPHWVPPHTRSNSR